MTSTLRRGFPAHHPTSLIRSAWSSPGSGVEDVLALTVADKGSYFLRARVVNHQKFSGFAPLCIQRR